MILIATSFPVGTCLASLTLAKLPFPMVLRSLYFPMVGSSPARVLLRVDAVPIRVEGSTEVSFPPCKQKLIHEYTNMILISLFLNI